MKDQVEHLIQQGVKAAFINSTLQFNEVLTVLENCIFGNYKLLYVSPERLSSELFRVKISHMNVSFITVDEAHCISQWGYDFRPAYTRISDIRKILPDVPVLALTASATPDVVKDIQQQLLFKKPHVIRMSFARENLIYNVRSVENNAEREVEMILQDIPGSSIVYTRNRRKTYELAQYLVSRGISATFYHAGMLHSERTAHQMAWRRGETRVMVATNAFGMGIDKPDVRSVIHVDVPDSPEAYFQEAGRVGRDGKPAYAILFYHPTSVAVLRRRVEETYPPEEYIRKVYDDMCSYLQIAVGDGYMVTREFSLEEFCTRYRHYPVRAYNALQLLSRSEYIEWKDAEEGRSRVLIIAARDTLYSYVLPVVLDNVLGYILRTFTGMFSEYVYIEEDIIAKALGMPTEEVTAHLIELNKLHIISYIPRRFIPHITFVQRRLDTDEIILPRTIYDCRKQDLYRRIETVISYLFTKECRSKFLLEYFGEITTSPCGLCDNCKSQDEKVERSNDEIIRQRILQHINNNKNVSIQDLHFQDIKDKEICRVLNTMFHEEEIIEENFVLRINILK